MYHFHGITNIHVGLILLLLAVAQGQEPEATSGLQFPITDIGGGYLFEQRTGDVYLCGSGRTWVYHPGWDMNGARCCGNPDDGNRDLGTPVLAVANGKVVYANEGSWGGVVLQHLYRGRTFYSQYGHVQNIIVSNNNIVSKGQQIAEVDKNGADWAHLHFEIRSSVHPDPTYGAFWQSCDSASQVYLALQNLDNVRRWDNDPLTFVQIHGQWKMSPILSDCLGPSDASGRRWYASDFDDSTWATLVSPVAGGVPGNADRFFRLHFDLASTERPLAFQPVCDDGCEAYVNGISLGQWGNGQCHALGCVNIPGCGLNQQVAPKAIPSWMLRVGENVIGVHVSNGGDGFYFDAFLPGLGRDGLLAYYPFDDGNADDYSGGGNHGTAFGGVSYATGRIGQAASLDGSTGYIRVLDSPSLRLNNHSLTAWVNATAFVGGNRVVEKGNSDSYYLDVNPGARPLVGFFDGSYHDLVGSTSLLTNTWYFVAGTYDGTNLRLYLNGALVESAPLMSVPFQTSDPLIIGWKFGGIVDDHFAGLIDEVRIYNRALSASEIQQLFNQAP